MHKFKDLLVWQKSLDLAEAVYQFCKVFPTDEKFNLEAQIKRSVVSISSNIAEGAGRGSNNEFKHFIMIALGSSFELETQLLLAGRLKYSQQSVLHHLLIQVEEVQKMLSGLHKSLNYFQFVVLTTQF